jgi:hypothetical protein
MQKANSECSKSSLTPVLRHEGEWRAAMAEAGEFERRELVEPGCDQGGPEYDRRPTTPPCRGKKGGHFAADLNENKHGYACRNPYQKVPGDEDPGWDDYGRFAPGLSRGENYNLGAAAGSIIAAIITVKTAKKTPALANDQSAADMPLMPMPLMPMPLIPISLMAASLMPSIGVLMRRAR